MDKVIIKAIVYLAIACPINSVAIGIIAFHLYFKGGD